MAGKVDPEVISKTAGCLRRALAYERQALRLKKLSTIGVRILTALVPLRCARTALTPRKGEIADGESIVAEIELALAEDNNAVKIIQAAIRANDENPARRRKAFARIRVANAAKLRALTMLTGEAPPPEADNDCDAETADARDPEDDDFFAACPRPGTRVMSGRSSPAASVPVNEIELSARKPITRFNDWAVVGPGVFRSGKCTRLAASLVNCRIDPPMQSGQFFVVALGGLGPGTPVVMEIVFGNRSQHIRLTTK
jgi:hypothetical protein